MDSTKKILMVCECGDSAHQLIFSYWPKDITLETEPCVFVDIHLNRTNSFFQRIKNAIKYIFSYSPSIYGDFDEIILNPEDSNKMQEITDYLKLCQKNREK